MYIHITYAFIYTLTYTYIYIFAFLHKIVNTEAKYNVIQIILLNYLNKHCAKKLSATPTLSQEIIS